MATCRHDYKQRCLRQSQFVPIWDTFLVDSFKEELLLQGVMGDLAANRIKYKVFDLRTINKNNIRQLVVLESLP